METGASQPRVSLTYKCVENKRLKNAIATSAKRKRAESISATDKKRQRRFMTCHTCLQEYDTTQNTDRSCRYHPGKHSQLNLERLREAEDAYIVCLDGKEVDYDGDFWADHDEDCHGQIDGFVDDPDYAEGFIWACCEEYGNALGCTFSKHLPIGSI
jgi:hypothetical protein